MSDAAGTQRAEVAPPKPMYEAVQITAADYNPALAFERAFDGSPFTTCPDWIAVVLFYLFICGLVLGLAIWFAIGWPIEAIKRASEIRGYDAECGRGNARA